MDDKKVQRNVKHPKGKEFHIEYPTTLTPSEIYYIDTYILNIKEGLLREDEILAYRPILKGLSVLEVACLL